MMKNIAIALSVLAVSGLTAHADDLPDNFFGQNDPAEVQKDIGKSVRNIPIFPIVGKSTAPVKIDYFYSASCKPCKKSSESIFRSLSSGDDIQVSFHPLPSNQLDYDAAAAETILHSASRLSFSVFHIAMMTSEEGKERAASELLVEAANLHDDPDEIWIRMQNFEDWSSNLKVSRMIADEIGVTSLPTLVIGNRKYEGFVSHDLFEKTIQEIIDNLDTE